MPKCNEERKKLRCSAKKYNERTRNNKYQNNGSEYAVKCCNDGHRNKSSDDAAHGMGAGRDNSKECEESNRSREPFLRSCYQWALTQNKHSCCHKKERNNDRPAPEK